MLALLLQCHPTWHLNNSGAHIGSVFKQHLKTNLLNLSGATKLENLQCSRSLLADFPKAFDSVVHSALVTQLVLRYRSLIANPRFNFSISIPCCSAHLRRIYSNRSPILLFCSYKVTSPAWSFDNTVRSKTTGRVVFKIVVTWRDLLRGYIHRLQLYRHVRQCRQYWLLYWHIPLQQDCQQEQDCHHGLALLIPLSKIHSNNLQIVHTQTSTSSSPMHAVQNTS